MANKKDITPSDIRKGVAKGRSGNGNPGNGNSGNGNSRRGPPEHAAARGRLNLRDTRQVPDEVLRKEIKRGKQEVADEVGPVSFQENEKALEAARYFTYICTALQASGSEPPSSISHARRYSYDNQQQKYWRDQMVRALKEI